MTPPPKKRLLREKATGKWFVIDENNIKLEELPKPSMWSDEHRALVQNRLADKPDEWLAEAAAWDPASGTEPPVRPGYRQAGEVEMLDAEGNVVGTSEEPPAPPEPEPDWRAEKGMTDPEYEGGMYAPDSLLGFGSAFLLGMPQAPAFGFFDDAIGAITPGGGPTIYDKFERYQPEALTLGEVGASALMGGANLGRKAPAVLSKLPIARTLIKESLRGGVEGIASDALSRAGNADGGDRLEAALDAIPGMGEEGDPLPLGALFGTGLGLMGGGGQIARSRLRDDPNIGGTLRNIEERGGTTSGAHVVEPRPGVSMAPVEVPPGGSLAESMAGRMDPETGDILPGSLVPEPKTFVDSEKGVAATIGERVHASAAAKQERLVANMNRESESFLRSNGAQQQIIPNNLAETIVDGLSGEQAFSTGQKELQGALRELTERVEPITGTGLHGLAEPPITDSARSIYVTRGQLQRLGLEDMLAPADMAPRSDVPTVRPPAMKKAKDPTGGVMGEQGARGPLGEPLAGGGEAQVEAASRGQKPIPSSGDPKERFRIVLRPMNARQVEGVVDNIDNKVDWGTKQGGDDFQRFAAGIRKDREKFGTRWAAIKDTHSNAMRQLEEAKKSLGLGAKEKIDPRSLTQRNQIVNHITDRDPGAPGASAIYGLVDDDVARQGLRDIEMMHGVRKLTLGARPGRFDEHLKPMSIGNWDSIKLRLDPTMGKAARLSSPEAVTSLMMPALTLRDVGADFSWAPEMMSSASDKVEEQLRQQQEDERQIKIQSEAMRRSRQESGQ